MRLPVRVLIVDDSAFLRRILAKRLEADPELEVVGSAADGVDALDKLAALNPDVVIMDVEMPRMDGLAALQRIMAERPTPVVMLSALTQRGARTTIQALVRGAVDFVPKPAAGVDIGSVVEELISKVKAAAGAALPLLPSTSPLRRLPSPPAKPPPRPFRPGDPVIVIGASTGGPRALQQVLSDLPGNLPAAVMVVQHMPPGFTQSLAQRLNENSALTVQEATFGKSLERGLALVAPGDFHLRCGSDGKALLDKGPRRNHVRPAVDVAMESAAEHHRAATIGVVLTGMGCDGQAGAARIKAAGGRVIAEDASTSVIYGMPRCVVEAGLADQVTPLPQIAATLIGMLR